MSGSELLIVDSTDGSREGLRRLFDRRGFVCTGVSTAEEAQRLVEKKFFPAALVDLDVGGPGAGVDLVRTIRASSRQTSVVLLTGRKSFEGAVEAFRAGAIDVVPKTKDQVAHLTQVVERASERYQATEGNDSLYREVRDVLSESFKVMLKMCRDTYSHLSLVAAPIRPTVLFVDADQEFFKELAPLIEGKPWNVLSEMTGGGALDRGMSAPVDIIATSDELPDLPGGMVLRSLQSQHPDVLGVLYSREGDGKIERLERGDIEHTERPFLGAEHLVERVEVVAEELGERAQERRFIQAFSADNRDYLRRYAGLKMKIDRLISD